jgi:outer membrane protein/S-layer protein transport system outer membrane protein
MKSGLLRRWAFVTVCAIGLAGAQARAETLAEAVELAYRTNPNIQAQRASLRALDESYVQARAGFGLSAGVQGSRTDYVLKRSDRFSSAFQEFDATTNSANLTVQQSVYTGGRLSARTDAASNDIRAGRQQLRRAEIDLMVRVVQAYVSVRRDEQSQTIARELVNVLESQLSDTGAKFEVRQVTATDQAQVRARLAQARTQLANAEAQLNASRAAYLALVGRNPGSLDPEPQLAALPPTVEAAFDLAEAQNPQLLQAQFTEQASRARVAEAKAQRRPQLSIRGTAARNASAPWFTNPIDETASIAAVVSQPLFTGGALTSQIRQAVEQNNRDRLLIEDARRQMIQNVSQGWEQLTGARNALISQQDEAQADETAFYGVREEEKVGLRSTLEILNAAQELAYAQLAVIRGRANEYVSRVQLLGLIGTLTVDDLSPGAEPYDFTANFDKVKNKGALPWEAGLRAIDRMAGTPIGAPRPAATEPVDRPSSMSSLPAPPPPAAETKPPASLVQIMQSTRTIPADAQSSGANDPNGPVSTNRQAEPTVPVGTTQASPVPPVGAPLTAAPPVTGPPSPTNQPAVPLNGLPQAPPPASVR